MRQSNHIAHTRDYRKIEKDVKIRLGQPTKSRMRPRNRKFETKSLSSLKNDKLFNLLDKANPERQALLKQIAKHGFKNTAEAALSVLPPEPASPKAATTKKTKAKCENTLFTDELREQCIKAAEYTARLRLDVINAMDPVQRTIKGALNSIPRWALRAAEEGGDIHAMPGSIRSTVSPGGYLAHLYQIATTQNGGSDPGDGSYGVNRASTDIYHIDNRRPDIRSIQISEANAKEEIKTIEIVHSVLKSSIETKKNAAIVNADLGNAFFPPNLPYVAEVENTQISMKALGYNSLNELGHRTQALARPVDFDTTAYYFVNNVAEPLQLGTQTTDVLGDEVKLLGGTESTASNTWTDLHGFTTSTQRDVLMEDYINRMGIRRDDLNLLYRQYNAFDDMDAFDHSLIPASAFGAQLVCEDDDELLLTDSILQIDKHKQAGLSTSITGPQLRALNYLLRLNTGTGIDPVSLDWMLGISGATTAGSGDPETGSVKDITDTGLNLLAHFIYYRDTWGIDANTYVGMVYKLNPFGYFPPLPTEPENTEVPVSVVKSQLKTLFGDDAVTVRTACVQGTWTITSASADEAIKGILCAGLQISKAEWDVITPLLEGYDSGNLVIDEEVLSQIGRIARACRLTGMDTLSTVNLCVRLGLDAEILSTAPVTALSGINKLMWLSKWMKDNSYNSKMLESTLSPAADHGTDDLNKEANESWLTALNYAMSSHLMTGDVCMRYGDWDNPDNPGMGDNTAIASGDAWMALLVNQGTVNAFGLITCDDATIVEADIDAILAGLNLGYTVDTSQRQNLINDIWQLKLIQDKTTVSKIAELCSGADKNAVRPMLAWMNHPNVYSMSDALLSWAYDADASDISTTERTQLLWDCRNRLACIKKHSLIREDIGLLVGAPDWLSGSLINRPDTTLLDWPTLYSLTLFKHLQVGVATAQNWLVYLALVNEVDGEISSDNASILAGLIGCSPDDIITYMTDDTVLPTDIEAVDHIARRVDVGFELDLSAQEMIPLMSCAADNSGAAGAYASVQLALNRHESPAPGQLYKESASERYRDALVALYMKTLVWINASPLAGIVTGTESLYRYLLLDVNDSSKVPTSVIVEANSSLQLYIYRSLGGLEVPCDFINYPKLESNWVYDKDYRVWQANEELALYPGNYIEPEMRSTTSYAYQSFMSSIQGSDFEADTIDSTVYDYFESVVSDIELKVTSFCKEVDVRDSTIITYHFIGTSIYDPAYFYRTVQIDTESISERDDWLTSLKWSFWQPLSIPNVDTIASSVVVGGIENQLFFMWIELKQINADPANEEWTFIPYYAKANADLELNTAKEFAGIKLGSYTAEPTQMPLLSQTNALVSDIVATFQVPKEDGEISDDQYELRITKTDAVVALAWDSEELGENPAGSVSNSDRPIETTGGVFVPISQFPRMSAGFYPTGPRSASGSIETPAIYQHTGTSAAFYVTHTGPNATYEVRINTITEGSKWEAVMEHGLNGDTFEGYVRDDHEYASDVALYTPYVGASTGDGCYKLNWVCAGGTLPGDVEGLNHMPDSQRYADWYKVGWSQAPTSDSGRLTHEFQAGDGVSGPFEVTFTPKVIEQYERTNGVVGITECEIPSTTQTTTGGECKFTFAVVAGEAYEYNNGTARSLESYFCVPPVFGSTSAYLVAVNHSEALRSVTAQAPLPFDCHQLFEIENQSLSEGQVADFWADLVDSQGLVLSTNPPKENFDFDGAYGQYGWEMFYHVPSMIASAAAENKKYDASREWFKEIYNPQASNGVVWGVLPIKEVMKGGREPVGSGRGFNDPDELASANPIYYGYATVRQFIQMLQQAGDDMYKLKTQESLRKAKTIYTEALDLLVTEASSSAYALNPGVWSNPTLSEILSGTASLLPPLNYELYQLNSTLAERIHNLREWNDITGEPLDIPLYAPKIDPRVIQAANQKSYDIEEESDSALLLLKEALEYPLISQNAKDKVGRLIHLSDRISDAYSRYDDWVHKVTNQRALVAGWEDYPDVTLSSLDSDGNSIYTKEDLIPEDERGTPIYMLELAIEQSGANLAAATARLTECLQVYAAKGIELAAAAFMPNRRIAREARRLERNAARHSTSARAKMPATVIAGLAFGGTDFVAPVIVDSIKDLLKGVNLQTEADGKTQGDIRRQRVLKITTSLTTLATKIVEASAEVRAAKLEKRIQEAALIGEKGAYSGAKDTEIALHTATKNGEFYKGTEGYLNDMDSIYLQSADAAYEMCMLAQDVYNEHTSQTSTFVKKFEAKGDSSLPASLSSYAYQLELSMMQMDLAYQEYKKAHPSFEGRLQFSLASDSGMGDILPLEKLKEQGTCEFTLHHDIYDAYLPKQYNRRIEGVEVVFNGLEGDDRALRGILIQTGHHIQVRNGDWDCDKTLRPLCNKLLLNGSVTNTQDMAWREDNLMPFKGTGAVSSWRLVIPCLDEANAKRTKQTKNAKQVALAKEVKQLLRDKLVDVTINITYSALQS
jgi:hypothetical protein